jgi:hypothetical protein
MGIEDYFGNSYKTFLATPSYQKAPKGTPDNFAVTGVKAVGAGLASPALSILDALGGVRPIQDVMNALNIGGDYDTARQNARDFLRQSTLDAQEAGGLSELGYSTIKGLVTAGASVGAAALTGQPGLAAPLFGGAVGTEAYRGARDQGIDERTAIGIGAIQGAGGALGFYLAPTLTPALAGFAEGIASGGAGSVGRSLLADAVTQAIRPITQGAGGVLTDVAFGGLSNAGLGLATRGTSSLMLQNKADELRITDPKLAELYDQVAKQYEPLEASSLLADIALGSIFGATHSLFTRLGQPKDSDIATALATKSTVHDQIESVPGYGLDPETRASDAAKLLKAKEDLAAGDPVEVRDAGNPEGRYADNPDQEALQNEVREAVKEEFRPGEDFATFRERDQAIQERAQAEFERLGADMATGDLEAIARFDAYETRYEAERLDAMKAAAVDVLKGDLVEELSGLPNAGQSGQFALTDLMSYDENLGQSLQDSLPGLRKRAVEELKAGDLGRYINPDTGKPYTRSGLAARLEKLDFLRPDENSKAPAPKYPTMALKGFSAGKVNGVEFQFQRFPSKAKAKKVFDQMNSRYARVELADKGREVRIYGRPDEPAKIDTATTPNDAARPGTPKDGAIDQGTVATENTSTPEQVVGQSEGQGAATEPVISLPAERPFGRFTTAEKAESGTVGWAKQIAKAFVGQAEIKVEGEMRGIASREEAQAILQKTLDNQPGVSEQAKQRIRDALDTRIEELKAQDAPDYRPPVAAEADELSRVSAETLGLDPNATVITDEHPNGIPLAELLASLDDEANLAKEQSQALVTAIECFLSNGGG